LRTTFFVKAIMHGKYSGIGARERHSRLANANQPAEIHAITSRMTAQGPAVSD